MNVLIFTDMEGPSGIDDPNMLEDSHPDLVEKGRRLATQEVNAAVRGLSRAGATKIDVFDGHGMGGNLVQDDLSAGVNYLGGDWMTNLRDMIFQDQIKSYDALVLLGQHAAQGTPDGFISHTNTGVSALRLNGKFAGEAPQIAWLAGHFGVPTLLVAGDDAVAREVGALLPGVKSVVVKTSTTRHDTTCIPLDEAHALIEQTAYQRLKDVSAIEPCRLSVPIKVEIFFVAEEPAEMLSQVVNFKKTGERVVAYEAQDYVEAFLAYHSCRVMIQASYRSMFTKWLAEREDGLKLLGEYTGILRDRFKDTSELLPGVRY